jgi:hypothetical protein
MPVDSKANPRDKAIALGAVAFLIVGFIILYIIFVVTTPKPEDKTSQPVAPRPSRDKSPDVGD